MQAQQPASQDINMEDVLKMMCTVDGASEYVVTNTEGINFLIQESLSRKAII